MSNGLGGLSESAKWQLMVEAAKRGAREIGYRLERLPGRGMSNVWNLEKLGRVKVTSIRTTRDRWIAFPPLEMGAKWKTLDDVELVLVAAVDSKENPREVEVYLFDAAEVRERFDASYAARIEAGNVVRDGFGMWVGLDPDERGSASSVGSGLASKHEPIAVYSIAALIESGAAGEDAENEPDPDDMQQCTEANTGSEPPLTIAEAKRRLARSLGVDASCIKITVEA